MNRAHYHRFRPATVGCVDRRTHRDSQRQTSSITQRKPEMSCRQSQTGSQNRLRFSKRLDPNHRSRSSSSEANSNASRSINFVRTSTRFTALMIARPSSPSSSPPGSCRISASNADESNTTSFTVRFRSALLDQLANQIPLLRIGTLHRRTHSAQSLQTRDSAFRFVFHASRKRFAEITYDVLVTRSLNQIAVRRQVQNRLIEHSPLRAASKGGMRGGSACIVRAHLFLRYSTELLLLHHWLLAPDQTESLRYSPLA
jgi:hypothetical protein